MSSPDVSVVIPTYNRRTYVQQAIESCFEGNDGIRVEAVVVDDGSTDGTRDYLEQVEDELPVRAILQEHQGAQVARNAGQQAAWGTAVKHLDDDDYLLPGTLEIQYRCLQRNQVDVCYGDYYYQDDREGGQADRYFHNGDAPDFFTALLSKSINRLQLAILFRVRAIEDIRWDESLDYLQDVHFMTRVASRGLSSVHLDRPVAVHRLHGGDRISDVRKQGDVVHRVGLRCEWYWKAYQDLKDNKEEITDKQRRAAATGLWKEAHKLAPFDWDAFQYWYDRVRRIDAAFLPPRSNNLISVLDRFASPYFTEWIINPLRRHRLGA
jgi:glycosyltransferase involved in cell wall biosynthesis